MAASDILRRAADIVGGDRNATHGEKEDSFEAIAAFWNVYDTYKRQAGPDTPRDVAQKLVLMKVARSIQGSPVADHFLDQAGYSAIAGELAACERMDKMIVRAMHACHLCGGVEVCEIGCPIGKEVDRFGGPAAVAEIRKAQAEYRRTHQPKTECTPTIHDRIAETPPPSNILIQEGDTPDTADEIVPCTLLATKGK